MFSFLRNGFNSVVNYTFGRNRKRKAEEMISHYEGVPGAKRAIIGVDEKDEPPIVLGETIDFTTNERSVSEFDSDPGSSFSKRLVYSERNRQHRVRPIIRQSRRFNSSKSEQSLHHRTARRLGCDIYRRSRVEELHTSWVRDNKNGPVPNGDSGFVFTPHYTKAQTSASVVRPPPSSFSRVSSRIETLSAARENDSSRKGLRYSRDVKVTDSGERKWFERNGKVRELGRDVRNPGKVHLSASKVDDDDDDEVMVTGIEISKRSCVPKSADFEKLISQCRYTETDWLTASRNRSRSIVEENFRKADALQKLVKECEQKRSVWDSYLSTRVLRYLRLTSHEPTPVPDLYYEPEDEEEEMPVITPKMRERIASAMACHPSKTLVSKFRLEVSAAELRTLQPRQWLSDMVINFYMQLIAERSMEKNDLPKCHPMSTFFYPKLQQSGYEGVRRWTRRIDIFEYDFVLVPIHLGQHWCFALVQTKEKKISYFDSMQQPNNECLSYLMKYLVDEMKTKKQQDLDINSWSVENAKNIPVQRNGYDCGVFTCQFAEFLSRRAALTFSQNDMTYFRERMIYEILEMKLLI